MGQVITRTQQKSPLRGSRIAPVTSKHGFVAADLKTTIRGFFNVNSIWDLDLLFENGWLVFVGSTLEEFYKDVVKECPVPMTPDEFAKAYSEQEGWDTFLGRYVIMNQGVFFINFPADIEIPKEEK